MNEKSKRIQQYGQPTVVSFNSHAEKFEARLAISIIEKHAVIAAVQEHNNVFRIGFADWLSVPVNLAVWQEFEFRANAIWGRGYKHYSARTIGEAMRYHSALSDTSLDFKLNDHTWPDLARLYMLVYPEREGFFETRGRRAA